MSQEEKDIEFKIEKIEVVEDETAHTAENGRTWKEEFEVAGGELGDFLKKAMHEVTVRRIIVTNKHGRTLVDVPVAVGALALIPQVFLITAGLTAVAILANCKVTLVHSEKPASAEESGPAEEAPAA